MIFLKSIMNQVLNKINENNITEKMMLKNWDKYRQLVAKAYKDAPSMDSSVVKHWNALNRSNYTLFKRLLSKTKIILVTENQSDVGKTLNLAGKSFKVEKTDGEPYGSQAEMKADWEKNKEIKISIDYSDHPIFSVEDNVIFRCVHDFIVHILGNHPFGDKGEIASYNLHAKLVPPDALPAIFTEIVGQACYAVEYGEFGEQKIAVLNGFDYKKVGVVTGYDVQNKALVPGDKQNEE
jgi:hypothetical protein